MGEQRTPIPARVMPNYGLALVLNQASFTVWGVMLPLQTTQIVFSAAARRHQIPSESVAELLQRGLVSLFVTTGFAPGWISSASREPILLLCQRLLPRQQIQGYQTDWFGAFCSYKWRKSIDVKTFCRQVLWAQGLRRGNNWWSVEACKRAFSPCFGSASFERAGGVSDWCVACTCCAATGYCDSFLDERAVGSKGRTSHPPWWSSIAMSQGKTHVPYRNAVLKGLQPLLQNPGWQSQ